MPQISSLDVSIYPEINVALIFDLKTFKILMSFKVLIASLRWFFLWKEHAEGLIFNRLVQSAKIILNSYINCSEAFPLCRMQKAPWHPAWEHSA